MGQNAVSAGTRQPPGGNQVEIDERASQLRDFNRSRRLDSEPSHIAQKRRLEYGGMAALPAMEPSVEGKLDELTRCTPLFFRHGKPAYGFRATARYSLQC